VLANIEQGAPGHSLDIDDVARRLDRRASLHGDRDDVLFEALQLLEQLGSAPARPRWSEIGARAAFQLSRLRPSAITYGEVSAADARLTRATAA